MMRLLLIFTLASIGLFANSTYNSSSDTLSVKHVDKRCKCDKPIIFDETPLEKIFELKGKIYKVLKGDDTNPTILYILDTKTNKFIRIKQR